jgi:hypothetical protein
MQKKNGKEKNITTYNRIGCELKKQRKETKEITINNE